MCNCRSYNGPHPDEGERERVLDQARYFPDTGKPLVSIDACIAHTILALWEAGIRTGGCCCGHNGLYPGAANGNPYVIIEHAKDAARAEQIIASLDSRPWWVIYQMKVRD